MNHLFAVFHAFEHKNAVYDTTSNALNFHEGVDLSTSCFYCDTYLNLDYTQQEFLSYSLIAPDFISERFLEKEKQLLSSIVYRKKSRSPPSYNS